MLIFFAWIQNAPFAYNYIKKNKSCQEADQYFYNDKSYAFIREGHSNSELILLQHPDIIANLYPMGYYLQWKG